MAGTLFGCPSAGTPGSALTCLGCHNGRVAQDMRIFLLSAHRTVDCATCHPGAAAHVQGGGFGGALINPAMGPFDLHYVACAGCHADTVAQYEQSVHRTRRAVACYDCHNVHTPIETIGPTQNNLLCLTCHVFDGFQSEAQITEHTNHPLDPTGTGASRCTHCHMPPLGRQNQSSGPHDHTFATIPPIASVEAAQAGEPVIPPNSCAGIMGCHDGTVPAAPIFDVDDPDQMMGVQAIYDFWFGDGT
jgi:hypothetical protein